MKRILSVTMAMLTLGSLLMGLAGCSPNKMDTTKTHLYVANYNGGVGEKWLDNAVERFEEANAGVSFEKGKTGIDIHVDHDKSYDGLSLATSIMTSRYDVFFTQMLDYNNFVGSGYLLPLTDLVEETVGADGKTIVSKLTDNTANVLKVSNPQTSEKDYFAIPHYELYQGIQYDAGMFKNKKLYFSDRILADGTRDFVVNANSKKSPGPDGRTGTSDDGLPSSFEEFYKLINKADQSGVPFIWTGKSYHYTNMLLLAAYTNYVGAEGVNLNLNFENSVGETLEVVTGWNGDGTPIIQEKTITHENAYYVKQSAGLYYALELAHRVFNNSNNYYPGCTSGSFGHLEAQKTFMRSGLNGKDGVAMLIDGNYWFNESTDANVFKELKKDYPDTYQEKDIKWMHFPHLYKGTQEELPAGEEPIKQVLVDSYSSYAVVKSRIKSNLIPAAKAFLSFLYTDEELLNFTQDTNGVIKAVNYDYTSIIENLPSYAKDLLALREDSLKGGSLIKTLSNDKIFISNYKQFSVGEADFWYSKDFNYACNAFAPDAIKKATVKSYFEGMWIGEAKWKDSYNIYN